MLRSAMVICMVYISLRLPIKFTHQSSATPNRDVRFDVAPGLELSLYKHYGEVVFSFNGGLSSGREDEGRGSHCFFDDFSVVEIENERERRMGCW